MKINMTVDIYESIDFDDSQAESTEIKDGNKARLEWILDNEITKTKEFHEGDRKMFEWLNTYKEFEGTISQVGETLGEYSLSHSVPK
jgi:hypothetical protein